MSINDCEADAENTVGRSSSMNFSTRSLYKLYTLAIQDICEDENKLNKHFSRRRIKLEETQQVLLVQLNLIKCCLFCEIENHSI